PSGVRHQAVAGTLGIATVSVAPSRRRAGWPFTEPSRCAEAFGETPKAAGGTPALPNPTAWIRLEILLVLGLFFFQKAANSPENPSDNREHKNRESQAHADLGQLLLGHKAQRIE